MHFQVGLKFKNARKEHFIEWFLAVVLLLLIVFSLLQNFILMDRGALNSDVSDDISFRQDSWEQKSLFPDGFVGPHYPLACRSVLIYWFFYGITHNFLLSFQLELCVIAAMSVGVFFLGGVQLFFMGVLGEYVLAINAKGHHRPLVIEEKRINFAATQILDKRDGKK